ncbi:Necrosis inducing protein NPP1 [Phytophthora megakarya]|uniref:Necrosis inducing protein NPP1 n=1 Tax=Phytophthora megakarya TaxID=4795 RepID=A0A225WMG9_9STRA|nr:Necrosis inducing protein NPP1 [Phytophthora megakarya]
MNFGISLLVAIVILAVANGDIQKIKHDEVQPFPQPEPTTDSEKSAVKYKPHLYISNGCHPYPAVQADGAISGGLKWSGWSDGDCEGPGFGSQVYSRSDWYKGKWAIMYTWFFPKGSEYQINLGSGHRYLWLYAIVWTDSPNPDTSTILGVSMSANIGHEKEAPPDSKFVSDGTTIKFDSYSSLLTGKQTLQLTTKEGETQDLITWEQLTDEARKSLSEFDFNSKWSFSNVVMPLKDDEFTDKLNDGYPF